MSNEKDNKLVSIVMAVHNSEEFLRDTINSVLAQTLEHWELIVVNDASTDQSREIAAEFSQRDARIKIVDLAENAGAAVARNAGTKLATGRFLAFIDSDDIWVPEKLEKQVEHLVSTQCPFVFSRYEFMSEMGDPLGRIASVPETITYKQALRNTAIWTSTVVIDLSVVEKEWCMMPNVRRGQDTLTWFQILKNVDYGCGMQETLAFYRQRSGSLSSNKITALRRTWNNYRHVEKLGFFDAVINFSFYVFNAIRRRV